MKFIARLNIDIPDALLMRDWTEQDMRELERLALREFWTRISEYMGKQIATDAAGKGKVTA